MARSYAPLMTTIWSDEDFVALDPDAQRIYLLALSQPNITYCGVVAYTPKRWARMSAGSTVADVESAVQDLVVAGFVRLDDDTEELWVRSFVRHNGVLTQPQLAKSMARSFEDILSAELREAFLLELPEDLPASCDTLSEARRQAARTLPAGCPAGPGQDQNPDPDPDLPSSSVTSSTPATPDDDDVLRELALLKLDANPEPVAHRTRWLDVVIAEDRAAYNGEVRAARHRFPTATAGQVARFLFDGTAPPDPPKILACSGCGERLTAGDEFTDHFEACTAHLDEAIR
jgi:hypothetical protein